MKIFSISAEFDKNGFAIYKNVRPSGYDNWVRQSSENIDAGMSLNMRWDESSSGKEESEFILFPLLGIASKNEVIDKIAHFAPGSRIVSFEIIKSTGDYGFIDPKNYIEPTENMDHIFLMFKKYKALLVTEFFKNEWKSLGFTGAEFNHVADISDENFTFLAH